MYDSGGTLNSKSVLFTYCICSQT